MIKESKSLKEIHEIMEKIYEEEMDLSDEERVERIRAESDRFLKDHNLNLKRIERKIIPV